MEPFVWHQERPDDPGVYQLDGWATRFPGLSVGFTSRIGGASQAPFASLNCGLHVADDPEVVVKNRQLIAQAAGFPYEVWTNAEQVHGNRVAVIGPIEQGRGRSELSDALPDADGMITSHTGIGLTAFFADCVPLYFYDSEHRAIGIAHAGWKGTAAQIAVKTAEAMGRNYGSRPEYIHAAIGPSIGSCCYEVDERVAAPMRELDEEQRALKAVGEGKSLLDLKEINRQLMIKAGILPEHIEISHLCTSCRTDVFFSHRKEGGSTGRMAGWIYLKR